MAFVDNTGCGLQHGPQLQPDHTQTWPPVATQATHIYMSSVASQPMEINRWHNRPWTSTWPLVVTWPPRTSTRPIAVAGPWTKILRLPVLAQASGVDMVLSVSTSHAPLHHKVICHGGIGNCSVWFSMFSFFLKWLYMQNSSPWVVGLAQGFWFVKHHKYWTITETYLQYPTVARVSVILWQDGASSGGIWLRFRLPHSSQLWMLATLRDTGH